MIGGLDLKVDHVTCPGQFHGRFVICRLGLAMFNPHNQM